MPALGRRCYEHRYVVIVAWMALLVGLWVMSQSVTTPYDNSLSLPGTGSGHAQELLLRSAPSQAGDVDQIVWHVDQGRVTDPDVQQRMSAMLAKVAQVPEVASVAGPYGEAGTVQVSPDGRTAYATVTFVKEANDLERAHVVHVVQAAQAARRPGLQVDLGGKAISNTEQTTLSGASAIGLGAAAVILLIAFGSLFAMALPIVTALAGVGSGLMLITPLSHLMSVSAIAPILGALIGLGVGVDYALFIVTRYRRGLHSGLDPKQATVLALNTSGRAVLVAAGTVVIALLSLLTIGLNFLNGLAVAAALTVSCTVLAAVTLLPALFGVFRTRVLSRHERRRLRAEGPGGPESSGSPRTRWSRVVPRFAWALTVAGLAVMFTASAPVLSLRLGFADASNDPASSHSRQAYEMLARGFGPGFNGPLLLVSEARSDADRAALEQLDRALAVVPGVAAVQAGPARPAPDGGPTVAVAQVIPTTAPQDPATSDLIAHLRHDVIATHTGGTTLRVYVGGFTATFDDFASMTSEKLPWLLAVIVGLGFLLLMVAFRSLLIPAVTAVMNVLAAAASFGILTAFFQWGWGTSALGLGEPSPVQGYLPELVLAVLFGLSMDYQVFLVSRMAEEWSHSRDNARAVAVGLTHTARVINAAAMIMIAVFASFVFMGERGISEFGVGLAAAVALDAFVLRTVLVPAVMHLCGDANWWLPGWLDRRLPHLAIEPAERTQRAHAAKPGLAPCHASTQPATSRSIGE